MITLPLFPLLLCTLPQIEFYMLFYHLYVVYEVFLSSPRLRIYLDAFCPGCSPFCSHRQTDIKWLEKSQTHESKSYRVFKRGRMKLPRSYKRNKLLCRIFLKL
ncbi:hypothetical protein BKA61DRAFT_359234 [Leptodontidium sp. MPI-SDFR-AT-0119]|nr:hypothetical protein BKA61DRAFT_359234 [Leptodontidium sp. MPI-SDFR-AT-0119]